MRWQSRSAVRLPGVPRRLPEQAQDPIPPEEQQLCAPDIDADATHPLRFRSAGGCDEASNRTTLCACHHQRCLHAGLMRILGRAPDGLIFELGLRPDSSPLLRYRSGDIAVPRTEAALRAAS